MKKSLRSIMLSEVFLLPKTQDVTRIAYNKFQLRVKFLTVKKSSLLLANETKKGYFILYDKRAFSR